MNNKFRFIIPESEVSNSLLQYLSQFGICYLVSLVKDGSEKINSNNVIAVNGPFRSSVTIDKIKHLSDESLYTVFVNKISDIKLTDSFFSELEKGNHKIAYSDYSSNNGDAQRLIDYQAGSIRDGFDFGPLIIVANEALIKCESNDYKFAGLYDMLLQISEVELPYHITKVLYEANDFHVDSRKSGEKQFDYLNPNSRDAQIEFEKAATEHLKRIGAYIDSARLNYVKFRNSDFDVKVSVVIPVYNRCKTIADAIKSALSQDFSDKYNVIVVDNHSTDGTTEIIDLIAKEDERVIHIIPDTYDLGIGGCWNLALDSDKCGMFAVQLDSDDIYKDSTTISKIVGKFESDNCAMVIGSYAITDFQLNSLPPGIIDHKEWTDRNGMNNALRINGLGAPRAFYTPIARTIRFKNCSYGEDYAMALAISRQFKLSRIYDILYICRRWEGNSDANLTREKENKNNYFKDGIRTEEIEKRCTLNKIN